MGKRKGFTVRRGEKRKKNSNGNDKFKKKQKFSRVKGKDDRSYSIKGKNESNLCIGKKSVESKEVSHEESEDENVFNQLISSLNVPENSKYISSSDSDSEDSVKGLKIFDKEEELEDNASFTDDDNDTSSLVEDFGDEDLSKDPFEIHFQRELSNPFHQAISSESSSGNMVEHNGDFPILGKYLFTCCKLKSTESNELKCTRHMDLSGEKEKPYAVPGSPPVLIKTVNLNNLNVKTQIQGNIFKANIEHANPSVDQDKLLSPFQKELFSIVNNYQDLYYPNRTLDNGEDVRFIYSLHAINHALKTRLKVIHHNARLPDKNDVPDDFRDQGLVRPKVLIIVPFRDSALHIIKIIISILLPDEKANIVNKKRFFDEFTGGEIVMPHKNPKPVDYEETFKGNTDDNFRIGISVTKKSLKLYADFYSSDIIVASPLGLRLIIGAEGEAERDYDFLASIEVLVLDQAEIFLMQNWDHLLHVMDHLHLQPLQGHGTDFSRVRNWALNGWTQYYRQTLLFSSQPLPLITSLFVKKCKNYAGKITITNPVMFGSICQVAVKVPQVFCRIESSSSVESVDKRFAYFTKEVLPQMRDPFMNHTIIFVPSYLDYVMIRNYLKKETISFVQICEYSKDGKIARARDKFFHGESHFLLYSERFHFFRRIRVKGIHHIVFYQPPTFPHFYSEMCNLILDDQNTVGSVTTLYTKYDIPQLAAIVGTERVSRLLKSNNSIHRIVSK